MAMRPEVQSLAVVARMGFLGLLTTFIWSNPFISIGAEGTPATTVKPVTYTEAHKQVIAQVKSKGGQVLALAQTDARLDVSFHLSDQPVTDEQLALLPGLPEVAILNLRGTKITDAGLVHVGTLKNLLKLHLEKTAITDAGLAHLSGLEKLEYLNLYGTKVTGAGVKGLAKLPKLQRLYLWQTEVSDADLQELQVSRPELKIIKDLKTPPTTPAPEEPKK
ncbi:hypothetical protein Plim_0620 [Planctopirus limnophila DSM 3776]|uniref:Leucine Rich repeats (2 copies) n=1 Tax=Planctopirus limnophila (strain ATCC 43296 / DSM 3776 / IFAM 1008 / Mu 290) TaxID=521674 RepID=D5SQZ9_PLAL2|nr:hypothetical protein [Planctopirus limnophila]ADG66467.1 hypothetical protein Plim_0620 [Planctopirus limnophila DSM 3776]